MNDEDILDKGESLVPIEVHDVSLRIMMAIDPGRTRDKAREVLKFLRHLPKEMAEGAVLEQLAIILAGRVAKIEVHGGLRGEEAKPPEPEPEVEEVLETYPLKGKSCREVDPKYLSYALSVAQGMGLSNRDIDIISKFLKKNGYEVSPEKNDDYSGYDVDDDDYVA